MRACSRLRADGQFIAIEQLTQNDVSDPPSRVVANSAWLMLAQAIGTLVGGGVSIYAIRTFTPSSWGHYSTALALVAVFTLLSGPGLASLALREIATGPERQSELLGMAFQALGWTFCVAAIALFATTTALGYPHQVLVLVLVLAPLLALDPALGTLAAAFNARSRLAYVALFQVAQWLVFGTVAVVVIARSPSVTGLAFATLTGELCSVALGLMLVRSKLGVRLHLNQPRRKVWSFLRAAAPIGGISLVGVLHDRADILMLSLFSNASSVAHYAAPYSFLRVTLILPAVVSGVFFPLLNRRIDSRSPEAEYLFFLIVRVFLFLSVPISLVVAIGSPTLVPLVLGSHYAPSVRVLQIMAWASAFGFQNYILWYGVLASHQERAALRVQVAGLATNVCLNAVAIPLYGPRGAAIALIASDLVIVVGQVILIHRGLFRVPFAEILTKPVVATIVVVPIAALLATKSALGGALAGATAYVAILLVAGYVTLREWQPLITAAKAPLGRLRRAA